MQRRLLALILAAGLFPILLAHGADNAANKGTVITFSTLANPAYFTLVQAPIPPDYQPLNIDYKNPDGFAKDGGNIGITITWNSSAAGAKLDALTPPVGPDHTGDKADADMFGLAGTTFSMTFSQPVKITSLFWTFYASGPHSGTIAVYTKADDATPVATVPLSYPDPAGYSWHELKDFADKPVTRIDFTGVDEALNIDDVTVVKAN